MIAAMTMDMPIKDSLQWVLAYLQWALIYATMVAYLAAGLLFVIRRRRTGWGFYAGGFVLAVAAVIWRGIVLGHVPLQGMFDVMLFMAALMFPLSVFCDRLLRVGAVAADTLLGVILLIPLWFFADTPRPLQPALQTWLFAPHVTAYMVGYVIMAKAAVLAGRSFFREALPPGLRYVPDDEAIYRLVCFGMPFMTLGLLLGAVWGKRAWGDYWNWDPKEMCSLATWLAYVGYFHARATLRRHRHLQAAIVIVGFALVIMTLLWVNLDRIFAGLHNYAV
ncbi:MAG: cytochrome c biogenesis protein CcsA [Phycisphaerae bacterium]|nr:cytochrome c biogenesis protein CcsA [Phycisphaerae bacterium]